jgi:hypothetical protein
LLIAQRELQLHAARPSGARQGCRPQETLVAIRAGAVGLEVEIGPNIVLPIRDPQLERPVAAAGVQLADQQQIAGDVQLSRFVLVVSIVVQYGRWGAARQRRGSKPLS